jgi:hypothetical protein
MASSSSEHKGIGPFAGLAVDRCACSGEGEESRACEGRSCLCCWIAVAQVQPARVSTSALAALPISISYMSATLCSIISGPNGLHQALVRAALTLVTRSDHTIDPTTWCKLSLHELLCFAAIPVKTRF